MKKYPEAYYEILKDEDTKMPLVSLLDFLVLTPLSEVPMLPRSLTYPPPPLISFLILCVHTTNILKIATTVLMIKSGVIMSAMMLAGAAF
jgi:hypothetical protein